MPHLSGPVSSSVSRAVVKTKLDEHIAHGASSILTIIFYLKGERDLIQHLMNVT